MILEAEVIPFNEGSRDGGRGPGIEEFWHLHSAGVVFDGFREGDRHLCLAFFDVLYANGQSLLLQTYDQRRVMLETIINPIPGFVSGRHTSDVLTVRQFWPSGSRSLLIVDWRWLRW